MPEISRFLGIIIAMYYKDHRPPHFHVKYGDYKASFSINELKITEGSLPPRVISLVLEAFAKLALRAKFDDFDVGSFFRKLTYPTGHRRFAKNSNPTLKAQI
jgi:hypothetical protein